jgi:phosphate-selective porin OprO/OprP
MKMRVVGLACALVMVFGGMRPACGQTVEELQKSVDELNARIREIEQWRSESKTMLPYWKKGLRMESADGSIFFRLGVNIQNDWAWISPDGTLRDDVGPIEDGVEFRRARLTAAGTINGNVEYEAEYDFAGGDADFKWVYMGLLGIPYIGNVRVGYMKEPLGLDFLTSNTKTIFMERGLPMALVPQENTGFMVHNHVMDDHLTYQVGVFRDVDAFGDDTGDGEYSVTGRVTGLPVYENEGARLIHLGVAGSLRNVEDPEYRIRQRPETHLSERLVDTGEFSVDEIGLFATELAIIMDSLLVQGESVLAHVDARGGRDPEFWGYYLGASYLLTGEHREYKTSSGVMSGVTPKRDFAFGEGGGPGAVELTARCSHLDLKDDGMNGGELDTFTAGVNWYLNPNVRVMLNYVYADSHELNNGDAHILQTRFQMAF